MLDGHLTFYLQTLEVLFELINLVAVTTRCSDNGTLEAYCKPLTLTGNHTYKTYWFDRSGFIITTEQRNGSIDRSSTTCCVTA
jgi:hypothetical protein